MRRRFTDRRAPKGWAPMRIYRLDGAELTEAELRLVRERFPRRWARASRLLREEDRLELLAAGVLLHGVLGISDEEQIRRTAEGKPWLEAGPAFSLSHSGGRCVLAVGEGPLGVDLERLDPGNLIAAEAALTEAELAWITPAPLERFHLLWTRKESVYKAVGGYRDPKQIEVLEGAGPGGLIVKSLLLEGFALSVCAGKEPGSLVPIPIRSPKITK